MDMTFAHICDKKIEKTQNNQLTNKIVKYFFLENLGKKCQIQYRKCNTLDRKLNKQTYHNHSQKVFWAKINPFFQYNENLIFIKRFFAIYECE